MSIYHQHLAVLGARGIPIFYQSASRGIAGGVAMQRIIDIGSDLSTESLRLRLSVAPDCNSLASLPITITSETMTRQEHWDALLLEHCDCPNPFKDCDDLTETIEVTIFEVSWSASTFDAVRPLSKGCPVQLYAEIRRSDSSSVLFGAGIFTITGSVV